MKKKILAVLLSLTLLLGIMPTAVFAADTDIVAKIGDVTYTDLQEAFKEAVEGDTVELTADVVLNGEVTATHSGIFDLGVYTVTSHCDISVMPVFVSAENNSVVEPPVISVDASLVDGIEDEHLEDTSVTLPEEELENILKEVNDNIGMEEAKQALEDSGILPEGSTDEVYLQIATEIKVVVLAYDDAPNTPNILQLEITPYYHVYATTNPATPVIIGEEQGEDFVLLDSAEYRIRARTLISRWLFRFPKLSQA